ncbi:unnamed protein product [Brassica napus]|uniref:(rape) hypothetical protein n=1 Tax=Brassica napus TaxID=3708 RepID=A0A816SZV9_BRANA|nr:unnamed protein product [Brassica napus]
MYLINLNDKSNLQYIFEYITLRDQDLKPSWLGNWPEMENVCSIEDCQFWFSVCVRWMVEKTLESFLFYWKSTRWDLRSKIVEDNKSEVYQCSIDDDYQYMFL